MAQRRFAMLMGCGEYESLDQLRCPRNDVAAMEALLKRPDGGAFDPVVVFDESAQSHEILRQLEIALTSELEPDDAMLIYYSGHGKLDKLGQLYLATRATQAKALDATSVALTRVMEYVERSRCKSILLVLDCCYSGAIKGLFKKGSAEDAIKSAGHGKGLFVITSSTDTQVSNEKEGDTLSLFTKYLVEGLETGNADKNNDGWISSADAYAYTMGILRGFGLQTPTELVLGAEGDFIISRNPNYKPVDPSVLSEENFERFFAVKTMIDMLNTKEPPKFFLRFAPDRGYEIEGERYRAPGLHISVNHTPNLRQTADGFECDAFFPPQRLTEHGAKAGAQEQTGVLRVKMRVSLDDFSDIIGGQKGGSGRQLNLYTQRDQE
jgi:hypothetical protein